MSRHQPLSIFGHGSAVSRFTIVFFLLLAICPSSLRAQQCQHQALQDCLAPLILCECCGYFPPGSEEGVAVFCYYNFYLPCVATVCPAPPPSPPSPPQPPGPPSVCAEPEIARGPAGARLSLSGVRPRDASGACAITFLDPVPDLQTADGKGITSNTAALRNSNTQVQGAAADSATRIVVRVGWNREEPVRVTLLTEGDDDPDNPVPRTTQQVGSLSSVGGSEQALQLTVKASGDPPMAFVVYRPPEDFVRGPGYLDETKGNRAVNVHADSAEKDFTSQNGLWLLRPPVVMIHGLGDSDGLWNGFLSSATYLSMGAPANYNAPVAVSSTGTVPSYPQWLLNKKANANQLGLDYNTPNILQRISKTIIGFRNGNNVLRVKAAAAQADVVAHSMGGLLARWAERMPQYTDASSFTSGKIHKLITIGTPHFGSNWATLMLADSCFQMMYADLGQVTFGQRVQLQSGGIVVGGLWDLQGDANGDSSGLNGNLLTLYNSTGRGAPTAEIAGKMLPSNLSGLSQTKMLAVAGAGAAACNNGPMWPYLTPVTWPLIFNNQPNDAIVSVNSQSADDQSATVEQGLIHTMALTALGFTGPAEITPGGVVENDVVTLLNGSTSGDFTPLPKQ